MTSREMICIVCPRGCRLCVHQDTDGSCHVSGNACPKGERYGVEELLNPARMVCSTVRTDSLRYPRCPVRSDQPIPKDQILEAMEQINRLYIHLPIHSGDILIPHFIGKANLIATRSLSD